MSIPKKGARKIVVEGETFIWLIRKQAANMQAENLEGSLHVAVEHAQEPGSVLVIVTDRPHPQRYSLVYSELVPLQLQNESGKIQAWTIERRYAINPVRPSDVALWIQQALQIGWLPKKSGTTFKVKVAENCLKKS
ncbi:MULTISPECIES: hypothetical protein [Kamptonema]|uniref:hypothetical protein n=1 Tax=Kamptonema TaxID=1501433 RepID=UPI0001DAC4C9|nr:MULTISPECIES: hypothetical protein [Kamptonema]CBN59065.1 hypothetical protein OSCI_4010015 [Kamptonema sp. PCC 6506]